MKRRILFGVLLLTTVWSGCGDDEKNESCDEPLGVAATVASTEASELVWEVLPDSGGVESAAAFGVPSEPHGHYLRLPAGFPGGPHTHTNDYRGVVISGRVSNTQVGDSVEWLGPGSFWAQPGDMPHVTACSAGTPCVVYLHWNGAFDFLPSP